MSRFYFPSRVGVLIVLVPLMMGHSDGSSFEYSNDGDNNATWLACRDVDCGANVSILYQMNRALVDTFEGLQTLLWHMRKYRRFCRINCIAFTRIHPFVSFPCLPRQTYVPILRILVVVHDILTARGGGSRRLTST
jgi:hypothetical protein